MAGTRKNAESWLESWLEVLARYIGILKDNVKKAIGLVNKPTSLHVHHAFLYISLLSLHNYDVNKPNFKFT